MKKEVVLLLGLILLIYGCDSRENTAEDRLADGNNKETAKDYQVPDDYNSIEQNIDALLEAGNLIGARHYDELEVSVNDLEENGINVKILRDKLSRLNVASNPVANSLRTHFLFPI